MSIKNPILTAALAIIALSLFKLAFFPSPSNRQGIIPEVNAQGSVIEWKDAMRIVSSGNDGATTYVWDYEGKTKVRKYSIVKGQLTLETFSLESEKK